MGSKKRSVACCRCEQVMSDSEKVVHVEAVEASAAKPNEGYVVGEWVICEDCWISAGLFFNKTNQYRTYR